ncbi:MULTISPECIES: response regulator [unclassified Coleofasciculus]|uniref:response regulator n=1 Tax=unclassified Coleofasciculus TaxID=2692782 RepID=UPI00187DF773|nr:MULTISPECIES: response regulator [unclassified Coleofasciculus]MBE9128402.1 response regulator [Coleofasciculus sp. LEGE 07081]MBE9150356.1 response regulator [Coleofasciculus sp. LEGE 07092]
MDVIPNLDRISRQLMSLERPQKPKMLVVDDEPDNLDLLYRTFRREFNVFRAESGAEALSVLANEGEVAVIISDQRMPEMKGTEFLSKTVPQFPDTMRIILTGFTDVEDLVEAINSGQVYKYITKPWDPNELKAVVQRATQTYELLKHRTEELHRAQAQMTLMETIVQAAQESESLETSLNQVAKAFGDSFGADVCIVQLIGNSRLAEAQGTYTKGATTAISLENDPLVQEAIETHQLQLWVNSTGAIAPTGAEHYQSAGIQMHLLIPVVYRGELLAVLSLQWQQRTGTLSEEELKLIHLSAQQVGLAIASGRLSP